MTHAALALLGHLADPDHPLALPNVQARAALAALLEENSGLRLVLVRANADRERLLDEVEWRRIERLERAEKRSMRDDR